MRGLVQGRWPGHRCAQSIFECTMQSRKGSPWYTGWRPCGWRGQTPAQYIIEAGLAAQQLLPMQAGPIGMPTAWMHTCPCPSNAMRAWLVSSTLRTAVVAHLDLDEVPQVVIWPVHLGVPPHQPNVQVGVRQQPARRLRTGRWWDMWFGTWPGGGTGRQQRCGGLTGCPACNIHS